MQIRNPFRVIRDLIDFHKYEAQINVAIDQFFKLYSPLLEILSIEQIKRAFWNLAEEMDDERLSDWNDVFCVLILRVIMYDILLDEKRIHPSVKSIHREWINYLIERILPKSSTISNDFFATIYEELPAPFPDRISAKTLIREEADIIKESGLPDILFDENINPITKLRRFQEAYLNLYEIFLRRCQYIEKEMAKVEDRRALRKMYDIFQLNNNNERTPPKFIEKRLIILIHIRNACSHKNISLIDKETVRIIDQKPNTGEITFKEEKAIPELWNYFYVLELLDMNFSTIALTIALKRELELYAYNNTIIFNCRDCGKVQFGLFLPHMQIFICRTCKMPYFSNNTMYTYLKLFYRLKQFSI